MSSLAARNSSLTAGTSSATTVTAMTTQSNNSNLEATTTATGGIATSAANNMNVVSGTCTFSANNSANASTTNHQHQQQPEDYYQTLQPPPAQQHSQQYQKHNNYYHPPPAVGNSAQQLQYGGSSSNVTATTNTTAAAALATTTGLATFNGNSNLENVANGSVNNSMSGNSININNNNNIHNSNYNNGNSSTATTLTHKMNNTTSSTSSSPVVVVGKTDATSTSSSSSNSILSGSGGSLAPALTSAFSKKQQQQQLHASREDVADLSGGGGVVGGGGGFSTNNSQSSSTNANSNNNNHHQHQQHHHHHHPPPPQHQHQHHHLHHHHNPPPAVYSGGQILANGGGNSSNNSSSSQHNLNSILKGSKENLLQNNYSNGSIGGSTTGSETGGGTGNMTEQDDPGDGLGPLPPKWETAYTERGELYFIDHNTGTSHWLDPRLSKFQKKSLEECTEGELPYGWEKIEDSLYGTYYIDHVNRKTQYENPVLEAKRRAAEQKQNQHQQQLQQQQAAAQQQRPQTPSSSSVLNGAGGASIALSSVSSASTLSTVDISQRAMQPPPPMLAAAAQHMAQNANKPKLPYKFTRNPADMQGERISTTLLKSARGLGITIVGGDGDGMEEFLQIKSIVPNGPAWVDGQLLMGDVLVYVNDTCVLGFTHHEMVNVFQSIMVGDTVTLEVCRGYPLPFDPNDPNTEVVTTIAVDGISNEPEKQRRMLMDLNMDGNYNFLDISGTSSNGGGQKLNLSAGSALDNSGFILMKKPEVHTFSIIKGAMGFGFTIADSSYGQKVKKILDRSCCHQLQEGDILLEINDNVVRNKSHLDVVQILKDCSKTEPTLVKIQRPVNNTSNTTSPNGGNATQASTASSVSKLRKNFLGGTSSIGNNALFRSKTPTADLYSTMQKEILPIRPKTPLVDTRRARVKTPNMELNEDHEVAAVNTSAEESLERSLAESKSQLNEGSKSQNSLSELDAINHDIPFMDPYPKMVSSLSERLASVTMQNDGLNNGGGLQHPTHASVGTGYLRTTASGVANYENQSDYVSGGSGNYSSIYGLAQMPPTMSPLSGGLYGPPSGSSPGGGLMAPNAAAGSYHHHHESCFCYECQDFRNNRLQPQHVQHHQQQQLPPHHQQPSPLSYYPGGGGYHGNHHPQQQQHSHSQYSPASSASLQAAHIQNERMQKRVNELLNDRRRVGFSPLDHHHTGISSYSPTSSSSQPQAQHLAHHPHSLMQQQQQQMQHQHSPDVSGLGQQQQTLGNWPNSAAGYNILQPVLGGGVGAGGLMHNGFPETSDILDGSGEQCVLSEVTLQRQALGFGFRIVGGTEEGSQVTVGHIVPGGAADNDHRITTGDEILSIDGINVVNSSHHKVVSLMGEAALRGQVTMILRRRSRPGLQQPPPHSNMTHQMMMPPPPQSMFQQPNLQDLLQQHPSSLHQQHHLRNTAVRYPYDVIVTRHENEGFGFVIISSSNQYYGSTIGKLIPGSPADRCGELKVGDRIISVNRIDIAGMSHGDVVNLIKESGLHVRLTIGCPKEGAIINAAPTMPAGSNAAAGSGVGLLINSAQASPGQVSQTPPSTNLQSNADNSTTPYFERPLLSSGSNNGSAASSSTHMSAQQSPNPLPAPPQL